MLNNKLINFFKKENWWFEESQFQEEKKAVLKKLSIPLDSSFAQFNLQVSDGTGSFMSKNIEIYNVCWDIINTNNLSELINLLHHNRLHGQGNLPSHFIPFSSFERTELFMYDSVNDKVYLVDEKGMDELIKGKKDAKWESFNDFLEWYFELN